MQCKLELSPISEFKKVVAAIQLPFPALTCLHLSFEDEMMPILPASSLGGSALGLQELCLAHVPFPELQPTLSATHLVNLRLWDFPSTGYISPETIVTCLPVLTRLETLDIGFELYPCTDNRRPPPPTCTPPCSTQPANRADSSSLRTLLGAAWKG
jgi:hypothetical protein